MYMYIVVIFMSDDKFSLKASNILHVLLCAFVLLLAGHKYWRKNSISMGLHTTIAAIDKDINSFANTTSLVL